MNRTLIAAMLAAASCAGIARAQDLPVARTDAPLTLARALEIASESAPSLDAAAADLRAAKAARTVAGLRPNPSLNLEAENVAGTGPYNGFNSLETTASLALPIELGGKRSARIAVADARSRQSAVQSAIAEADLKLAVTRAYVEAAAAERRIGIARDQARIAGEVLRAAEIRVRAGRASPIEIQRADVARINATAAAERATRLGASSRFTLEQRIGQPVPGGLDMDWFTTVTPRGDGLRARADGSLSLAVADAELAVAEAGIGLARSQRISDITLGAGARRFEASGDMAAVFSVSIPLPLRNNGRAAVAQATAERDRTEAQRRSAALDLRQAIAEAEAEAANAAVTAATANGPALAAAEEAARIARIGYREGKFSQLDLLDAERTLADTRTAAIDALAAFHIAQAQLDRLTARAPTQGE